MDFSTLPVGNYRLFGVQAPVDGGVDADYLLNSTLLDTQNAQINDDLCLDSTENSVEVEVSPVVLNCPTVVQTTVPPLASYCEGEELIITIEVDNYEDAEIVWQDESGVILSDDFTLLISELNSNSGCTEIQTITCTLTCAGIVQFTEDFTFTLHVASFASIEVNDCSVNIAPRCQSDELYWYAGEVENIVADGSNPQFFLPEGFAGNLTISLWGDTYVGCDATLEFVEEVQVNCPETPADNCFTNAADNIVVLNTNDSGLGSFREAIVCANATEGADTIIFAIPGDGPYVVGLQSALPEIVDDGTVIDGSTQTNTASADIILDGSQLASQDNGLVFSGVTNCGVYGLQLRNFDVGLELLTCSFFELGAVEKPNVVYACETAVSINLCDGFEAYNNYIGLEPTGTEEVSGNTTGISAINSTQLSIGAAGLANFIGNSETGIDFTSVVNSSILANEIGVSPAFATVSNQVRAIVLDSSDMVDIGDCNPGNGNIIGRYDNGIHLINNCLGNRILQNYIGTDPEGISLPCIVGIFLSDGPTNTVIGQNDEGACGNYIENTGNGIIIQDENTLGNSVNGNSFACNGLSLFLTNAANGSISTPLITKFSSSKITGIAPANSLVDIYAGFECTICEPQELLTSTLADGAGNWEIVAPYEFLVDTDMRIIANATLEQSSTRFSDCIIYCSPDAGTLTNSDNIIFVNLQEGEELQNDFGSPVLWSFNYAQSSPPPTGEFADYVFVLDEQNTIVAIDLLPTGTWSDVSAGTYLIGGLSVPAGEEPNLASLEGANLDELIAQLSGGELCFSITENYIPLQVDSCPPSNDSFFIIPQTDNLLCPGDTIVLEVEAPAEGIQVQWIKDGEMLAENSTTLTVSDIGLYEAYFFDELGCITSTSEDLYVSAFDENYSPYVFSETICDEGPITISMLSQLLEDEEVFAADVRWFADPAASFEVSDEYLFETSSVDSYVLQVYAFLSCDKTSPELEMVADITLYIDCFVTAAATASEVDSVNVFPNPSADAVFFVAGHTNIASWHVTDLSGREIKVGPVSAVLELGYVPAGMYLLEIRSRDDRIQRLKLFVY